MKQCSNCLKNQCLIMKWGQNLHNYDNKSVISPIFCYFEQNFLIGKPKPGLNIYWYQKLSIWYLSFHIKQTKRLYHFSFQRYMGFCEWRFWAWFWLKLYSHDVKTTLFGMLVKKKLTYFKIICSWLLPCKILALYH